MRRQLVVLTGVSAALLFLAGGCNRKDPEKCTQAMTTVRAGLEKRQVDDLQQWREYAYKHCENPGDLQKLDSDIQAKKKEILDEKAAAEAFEKERKDLITQFTNFVSQHRAKPEDASQAEKCPEKKVEPDEVWCRAERWLNREKQYRFDIRYWKAEPESVQFYTRTLGKSWCKDLGQHQVVKEWGTEPKWQHCKMTGGGLNGLHAIIEASEKQTRIRVVTDKYLERDESLKSKL